MSKKFGEIRQPEQLIDPGDLSGYIYAVDQLPDPSSVKVETCRFLLKYQEIGDNSYSPGIIYIVRVIDGEPTWIDISLTERGTLSEPTRFWKRLTQDSIVLHWNSPEDMIDSVDPFESATWDHEVIVRKRGEAPSSPTDGEIVGYSAVKNQYDSESTGFVHPLDPSYDKDFYYRVFAITKGGKYSGSESLKSSWTWRDIKTEIGRTEGEWNAGLYKKMFKIGDVFPLPIHSKYGELKAQIVDCKYSERRTINPDTGAGVISNPESLTFMITTVLGSDYNGQGGMSFDNKELKYASTLDTVFKSGKKYFVRSAVSKENATSVDDLFREYDFTVDYMVGEPIPESVESSKDGRYRNNIYEFNPSIRYFQNDRSLILYEKDVSDQTFDKVGNGSYIESNIRMWLNTNDPSETRLSYDGYLEAGAYDTDKYKWKIVDEETRLMESLSVSYWSDPRNGWFYSPTNLHDVAPEDPTSAHYIDVPLFMHGFDTEDGREFLNCIMPASVKTMSDQYVYRTIKTITSDTTVSITNVMRRNSDKFWIPSFWEIFGKLPSYGFNGDINYQPLGIDREGTWYGERNLPFKLFDPTFTGSDIKRSVPYSRNLRVMCDAMGVPCKWYTRSIDPTSPGRVFYVDSELPESDGMANIALTCTAHRPSTDDPIGAVVCFTIA